MGDLKIEWLDFDQWLKGRRVVAGKGLEAPLRMRKARRLLLGCDPADLEENVLDRAFAVMALCPEHTFQTLTKHPERMRGYMEAIVGLETRAETVSREAEEGMRAVVWDARGSDTNNYTLVASPPRGQALKIRRPWPGWPLPNVWLGVSVEDQFTADARREAMKDLADMGWLTWVSYEPALEHVDWGPWLEFIKWLVCGGESGPKARPMHPDWSRTARDQCQAAGVAFFFKQVGEWRHLGNVKDHGLLACEGLLSGRHTKEPNGECFLRVGKKAAGRLLDGREWNEMPKGAGDG